MYKLFMAIIAAIQVWLIFPSDLSLCLCLRLRLHLRLRLRVFMCEFDEMLKHQSRVSDDKFLEFAGWLSDADIFGIPIGTLQSVLLICLLGSFPQFDSLDVS